MINGRKSSSFASIVFAEAANNAPNKIVYYDSLGNQKTIVEGIRSLEKVEDKTFFVLESGEKIDSDLVYSVDYELSPLYSSNDFACDCV